MQLARVLGVVGLACAAGCRGAEIVDVPAERVHASQMSPIEEPKNAVARSFAEWQAFSGDPTLWAFGEHVDWSQQMLVAVALGSRPSGGYAVEIDRVVRKGRHLEVHARETRPAPGTMQTMAVTSPFDCVVVPRFDGKVVFHVE